ncbi:hypothetical protein BLNAU_6377 [Blattamonas nauphoetae]|uniref:Uncharacterized protein n=1 Tax=Blattamonas nauphoetae TaxID=2049346 RepID=A0ABQ9Y4D4_9EUKA|nr:hypothetical protein BLNAU_6377 [Blattamonas nauphoetae]
MSSIRTTSSPQQTTKEATFTAIDDNDESAFGLFSLFQEPEPDPAPKPSTQTRSLIPQETSEKQLTELEILSSFAREAVIRSRPVDLKSLHLLPTEPLHINHFFDVLYPKELHSPSISTALAVSDKQSLLSILTLLLHLSSEQFSSLLSQQQNITHVLNHFLSGCFILLSDPCALSESNRFFSPPCPTPTGESTETQLLVHLTARILDRLSSESSSPDQPITLWITSLFERCLQNASCLNESLESLDALSVIVPKTMQTISELSTTHFSTYTLRSPSIDVPLSEPVNVSTSSTSNQGTSVIDTPHPAPEHLKRTVPVDVSQRYREARAQRSIARGNSNALPSSAISITISFDSRTTLHSKGCVIFRNQVTGETIVTVKNGPGASSSRVFNAKTTNRMNDVFVGPSSQITLINVEQNMVEAELVGTGISDSWGIKMFIRPTAQTPEEEEEEERFSSNTTVSSSLSFSERAMSATLFQQELQKHHSASQHQPTGQSFELLLWTLQLLLRSFSFNTCRDTLLRSRSSLFALMASLPNHPLAVVLSHSLGSLITLLQQSSISLGEEISSTVVALNAQPLSLPHSQLASQIILATRTEPLLDFVRNNSQILLFPSFDQKLIQKPSSFFSSLSLLAQLFEDPDSDLHQIQFSASEFTVLPSLKPTPTTPSFQTLSIIKDLEEKHNPTTDGSTPLSAAQLKQFSTAPHILSALDSDPFSDPICQNRFQILALLNKIVQAFFALFDMNDIQTSSFTLFKSLLELSPSFSQSTRSLIWKISLATFDSDLAVHAFKSLTSQQPASVLPHHVSYIQVKHSPQFAVNRTEPYLVFPTENESLALTFMMEWFRYKQGLGSFNDDFVLMQTLSETSSSSPPVHSLVNLVVSPGLDTQTHQHPCLDPIQVFQGILSEIPHFLSLNQIPPQMTVPLFETFGIVLASSFLTKESLFISAGNAIKILLEKASPDQLDLVKIGLYSIIHPAAELAVGQQFEAFQG